ncbi:MAG TPA: Flp pilus assembly complex ATPase component TadA [Planctomycetes bacterium]|nr:Flp pilus assembly complex ATPase component TadA [Planctomycetota bacterium]
MPILLAAGTGYGGYISPVKFVVFVVLFFALLLLLRWVHTDAQAVRTKVNTWTAAFAAAGVGAIVIWLLAPFFVAGLLFYLIAVGATATAYVVHRNARVADFERVLTAQHLKGIFVNEKKKFAVTTKGISFITANNNKAPLPSAKTPEAYGYKTACEVFEDAIWRRTSDIIFQPTTKGYSVTYNIDGILTKQPEKTKEQMEYFIHYLKELADLDTNERRKPQTGNFKVIRDSQEFKWEVAVAGSTAGEQVKLTKGMAYSVMVLEDIGLDHDQLLRLGSIRDLDKGIFIISGPKKSGVTTTLYALLGNHDPFLNNINTLEKKPAAELSNITQHTFSLGDTGITTYARKLQTILRTAPDIIGIADCEDAKCAQLACAAARDGKIVYVTIEAANVISALGKWLKLVPDKNSAIENLIGILCQRLVRKLCDECKQAYQPKQDLCRKLNIPADKMKLLYRAGVMQYDKRGRPIPCENCQGTGFFGRTGIFEVAMVDEKTKKAVKEAQSLREISSHFRRSGMLYMQEQAVKKVSEGITAINEVIKKFSATPKGQKSKQ